MARGQAINVIRAAHIRAQIIGKRKRERNRSLDHVVQVVRRKELRLCVDALCHEITHTNVIVNGEPKSNNRKDKNQREQEANERLEPETPLGKLVRKRK